MKKWLTFLLVSIVSGATQVGATVHNIQPRFQPDLQNVPDSLLSSSKTAVYEWGCPVSEVVKAPNRAAALAQISDACKEDVSRAAHGKPGVFDVIKVDVVFPDVEVKEERDGFYLEGTFFLETLVMQDAHKVLE